MGESGDLAADGGDRGHRHDERERREDADVPEDERIREGVALDHHRPQRLIGVGERQERGDRPQDVVQLLDRHEQPGEEDLGEQHERHELDGLELIPGKGRDRETAPAGLYISQHKQPGSLQAAFEASPHGYELVEPYYRSGPLPPVAGSLHREEGTLEFLHRWEELIGGLCRAGFVVEDLNEPPHARADAESGTFAHRSRYIAPYVRIKARRTGESTATRRVWTPM